MKGHVFSVFLDLIYSTIVTNKFPQLFKATKILIFLSSCSILESFAEALRKHIREGKEGQKGRWGDFLGGDTSQTTWGPGLRPVNFRTLPAQAGIPVPAPIASQN